MKNLFYLFLVCFALNLITGCSSDDDVDPIMGCMDSEACNYDSEATEDDGSCIDEEGDGLVLITESPITVTGVVGEELVAHIYVRNESCDEQTLTGASHIKLDSNVEGMGADTKFCFGDPNAGGECYAWGVTSSADGETWPVPSLETQDVLQGYFKINEINVFPLPWTETITYTIENCCGPAFVVDVNFVVGEE